jgi:uncharacterized protein YqhQ
MHARVLMLLVAAKLPYGGQAVMEGVMMKGTNHAAVAIRRRDGSIEVLDRPVKSSFGRITKLPFLRGFFILWDMMTLGMWALNESSKRYEEDMEAEEADKLPADAKPRERKESPAWLRTLILLFSLAIALFLFKVLPAMAATGVFALVGWETAAAAGNATFNQQLLANLVEGLVKLAIFITYIWSVGRIAEIARVFQYHGAEHIVINAYEDNPDDQSLEFIQQHSTAHPRCGTSFIVILILLSVVLFTVLDWLFVMFLPAAMIVDNLPVWYIRWPLRILALPLLAGMSYEVIKAAFKYYGKPMITPVLRFGMLFQALTTRRPTDEQVVVSLASFNRARYLTEDIPEPELPETGAVPVEDAEPASVPS